MKWISPQDESPSQSNETERKTRKMHYKASWWTQFSTLFKREFLAWKRMPKVTTIRIYLTIVSIINELTKIDLFNWCLIAVLNYFFKLHSLLFGFVFWRQNYDQIGAMNINGAIYVMMNSMTNTLSLFVITVSWIKSETSISVY